MRRLALIAVALSALVATRAAVADTPPTLWEKAADPASGERYRLHVKVQEILWQAMQAVTDPVGHRRPNPMKNLLLESARANLEIAGAATSPDVRLRFDLGDVYYHLDRYKEALAVLQPALALAPRHSAASSAWLDLAYAAAKLDRSSLELDGYDGFLATDIRAHGDLSILGNRAEAEMRLGHLDAAVAGYRDVIAQAEHTFSVRPDILILARWGLAVALDRSHDPAGADHEAFLAAQQDPQEEYIGDKEDVFFVPEYERLWYYGLGRTQHARHATDPARALLCWNLVVDTWGHYVAQAARDDRWLGLAHAHLAAAEAEQRAAAARFAREKPGPDVLPARLRRRERPC